ncbi:cell division protein ZipA [Aliivibrio salmonicida]|uniref:cell division protein ZipA n=1 Tax=Aliivibrio salmonicida TaxID=40269 RepID=UPI00406D3574
MQELRLVLILVGALAIAALLFHGLWTSRKETSSKFGKKIDIDFDADEDEEQPAPERGFSQSKTEFDAPKERKEPAFTREEPAFSNDPLLDYDSQERARESVVPVNSPSIEVPTVQINEETVNEPVLNNDSAFKEEPSISFSAIDDGDVISTKPVSNKVIEPKVYVPKVDADVPMVTVEPVVEPIVESEPEPEEDVIVINVHGMGSERFSGNRLFNSLEQNGLVFGDMAIYHRHSDLSGSGKVLFSAANMVAPGHFQVQEGEVFSTPGISLFLPLPCYGDAEYNFKLMLQTAQLVSSELGGNILDEKRDMLTPNKIDEYKRRAKVFCRK